MIRDKEGNVVRDKENILQRWSDYNEKHFELQDGKMQWQGKRVDNEHSNCRTIC